MLTFYFFCRFFLPDILSVLLLKSVLLCVSCWCNFVILFFVYCFVFVLIAYLVYCVVTTTIALYGNLDLTHWHEEPASFTFCTSSPEKLLRCRYLDRLHTKNQNAKHVYNVIVSYQVFDNISRFCRECPVVMCNYLCVYLVGFIVFLLLLPYYYNICCWILLLIRYNGVLYSLWCFMCFLCVGFVSAAGVLVLARLGGRPFYGRLPVVVQPFLSQQDPETSALSTLHHEEVN